MRQLPTLTYSGLTAILDRRGRHDRNELISGLSGAYFDSSLAAGGYSSIHRATIEIRTVDSFHEPFLNGTKTLLLLGDKTLPLFNRGVSLDEQRGAPFIHHSGLTCVATYAPQDADDRRDYFSGEDDEEEKDDSETAEGKTTHGKTQRKNWRFWMRQDIKKASRLTATGGVNIPQPNYHFWPEIDKVVHLLTTTKNTDLYFDIETDNNLQMTCFGFSFYPPNEQSNPSSKVPDIYVVPMLQTYLNPKQYYYGDTYRLIAALAIALRDNTVVIHNSSFDLFVLAYRYGIPISGRVFDTMLAHNRCYIEVEKSLGHCNSLYTDLPYHKNEGVFEPHSYQQTQQLYEYNGKDVFSLIQIKSKIIEHATRLKALESVELANRMVVPYLTMTLQGIRLDTKKIEEVASYHTRWNEQLLRILRITTGRELNPNSWQQVSKYLYDDLGIKKPDKDPTAEKTLLQLLLKTDVPPVHCILKYRGNQKRISKVSIKTKKAPPRYYFGVFNRESLEPRITTSWRLGKTITMRLGSSKLLRRWGDNLQNWEKLLRKVIIPDLGKIFLQIDQSGAEALIVAYLCRAGQLRDIFLSGMNPHCFLGLHVFRQQFEDVMGRNLKDLIPLTVKQLATHKDWPPLAKVIKASDEWDSDKRYYFIAKQGNHSLNYDAKARAFRLNTLQKSDGAVALTIDQSQEVIDTRIKLFPELQGWWSEIVTEAKRTNILRNLFGHPRVITGRIEESTYKELYAFKPQSTVGQITNYAITEFQERISSGDELLNAAGVDVMQNNHDSMLVQCWNDPSHYIPVAHEMRKHFNRKLVSPRGEEFFMKSEIQIGESWGEMKELKLN